MDLLRVPCHISVTNMQVNYYQIKYRMFSLRKYFLKSIYY